MAEQDKFGYLRGNGHWKPKTPAPPTTLRSPITPLTPQQTLEALQQQAGSGIITRRSNELSQLQEVLNDTNDNGHNNED